MLQGDNIQAASIILNQVIDDNVLEQKKKMVTDIYIANKLNNQVLNSVQIATLNPIAHELGVYGGDATSLNLPIFVLTIYFLILGKSWINKIVKYTSKTEAQPDAGIYFIT